MKAVCMACNQEFEAWKGHLCEGCSKDYTVGKSTGELSFADKLMTAMSPLTRQVDNLLKNNALLGEILATLSLPRNQPYISEEFRELTRIWNDRRIKIKED
jgi:hypothetical protein